MAGAVPAPGRRHGRWGWGLSGVVIWCPGVVVEGVSYSKPRDRARAATICFPGTGVVGHHLIVLLKHLFAFAGGASYMKLRILLSEVWSLRETGEFQPRSGVRFIAWGVSPRKGWMFNTGEPGTGDRPVCLSPLRG